MSVEADIVALLRSTPLAVVATLGEGGEPQAAVVGIAVGDAAGFEIVFDTVATSRKIANLVRDPRIAVTAWAGEVTVQLEGRGEIPRAGAELDRVREVYFATHPSGRARLAWAGIAHVRVVPAWARLSDFTTGRVVEWRAPR